MEKVTVSEISSALANDRRGRFFAEIEVGTWVGLDNRDGFPVMFQGSLRDVLESFIPWSGEIRQANDVPGVLGITRTADSMVRFPLVKEVKVKRRKVKHT